MTPSRVETAQPGGAGEGSCGKNLFGFSSDLPFR